MNFATSKIPVKNKATGTPQRGVLYACISSWCLVLRVLVHGGQGKIAAIFDDARKNSPTILFFDEIDAMIKGRSKHNNVIEYSEVKFFKRIRSALAISDDAILAVVWQIAL